MNVDHAPLDRRRIVVDASCLSAQWSGVAYYTANATSALIDSFPKAEFHIFLGKSWAQRVPDGIAEGGSKEGGRRGRLVKVGRRVPGARAVWRATRALYFGRQMASLCPDIILAPNFLPPVGSASKIPVVPVIHDVSFLVMPDAHPKGRVMLSKRINEVAARAPAIVTVSEFSKREISSAMGVAPEKIFVAPPGVGESFRPSTEIDRQEVLARHGLSEGRYFLAIGTLEPRKNLSTLVNAYSRLPETVRENYALAIGGGAGWGDAGLSNDLALRLRRAGQLRLLGYVSSADLPLLYAGSAAFCFPSKYEGFGMPVTEAMACGAAVLASNAASIPEAAGTAGLLINPHDVEAWTESLVRICEEQDFTQSLRAAGPAWAAEFTWSRTAESIANTLEYALRA